MHLLFERSGSSPELRYSLLHEQLYGLRLRHDTNVSVGFIVNDAYVFLAEVVPILSAPLLVLVHKCLFGASTDIFPMPKLCYETHPLFASICMGWAMS